MSVKISELPSSVTPTTGDIAPLVKAGITVSTPLRNIHELFQKNIFLSKDILGNFYVSGNESISGNLLVSGNTFLGRGSNNFVQILGPVRLSGDLLVSGKASVTGDLFVSGSSNLGANDRSRVNLSGLVTTAGTGIIFGNQTVFGSQTVRDHLTISGSGNFGTVNSSQHLINGRTTFDGNTYFISGLTSTTTISGLSDGIFLGRGDFVGGFGASGNINLGSSSSSQVTVNGIPIIVSQAHFVDSVNIGQNLRVTGSFTSRGFNILGDNHVDTTEVFGDSTFYHGVRISGGVDITGRLKISGDMHVMQPALFSSGVSVGGPFLVTGHTKLGNSAEMQVRTEGDVFVGRHETISGNLNVSGSINLAQGFKGDYVKKCKFNPSWRLVPGLGMYYQGNGIPLEGSTVAVVNFPTSTEWHHTNKVYTSGDYVYITGHWANDLPTVPPAASQKLPLAFCGLFQIISADGTKFKIRLTGAPISAETGNYNALTRLLPVIVCSYRTGDLFGVSGIIPMVNGPILQPNANESVTPNAVHYKIIYNKPFSNGNYFSFLNFQERLPSEYENSNQTFTSRSFPSLSYLDSGDASFTIVTFNTHAGNTDFSMGSSDSFWVSTSNTAGFENTSVPRQVQFMAEEF